VFGALLVTGEYSTGTIRTSLGATPRRPILLAAKIGVTAAATVVFCELLSLVSFFLGQAILSGGGAPSANSGRPMRGISEPDVRYLPTNILVNSIMSTLNQGPGGTLRPQSPALGLLQMAIHAPLAPAVDAVLSVKRDG
jgi:hypothetical protein